MFKTQFSLLHSIRFIDYSRCKDTHFSPHITSAVGRCANKSMNSGSFVDKLGKLVVPPQLNIHFLHLRVGLQVVGHLVRGEDGYVIPRRLRLAEIGLRGRERIT